MKIGLTGIVLAALGTLAGCNPSKADKILREGQTTTSHSGKYIAEFVPTQLDDKTHLYPVIKDQHGKLMWEDDERYLMSSHPVAPVWQSDADVLWLLSKDIGNSRVQLTDGTWSKHWGSEDMPSEIKEIADGG